MQTNYFSPRGISKIKEKPNKSLHLTDIPLRFIPASELGRYTAKQINL